MRLSTLDASDQEGRARGCLLSGADGQIQQIREAMDLLSKMLEPTTARRITAQEARIVTPTPSPAQLMAGSAAPPGGEVLRLHRGTAHEFHIKILVFQRASEFGEV